jgi:hypothetical protein
MREGAGGGKGFLCQNYVERSLSSFQIEANGHDLLTRRDVVTDRQNQSVSGSKCGRGWRTPLPELFDGSGRT